MLLTHKHKPPNETLVLKFFWPLEGAPPLAKIRCLGKCFWKTDVLKHFLLCDFVAKKFTRKNS